jgi:hypothetical protein
MMNNTERSVVDMIQQYRLTMTWPCEANLTLAGQRPTRHRIRSQKEVNRWVAIMTGVFVVWMQVFCVLNLYYLHKIHGDWNLYPEWLTKLFYCMPAVSYIALFPARSDTKMERAYKAFMVYMNVVLVASRVILGIIDSIDKTFVATTDIISIGMIIALFIAFFELVAYTIWLQRDIQLKPCDMQVYILKSYVGNRDFSNINFLNLLVKNTFKAPERLASGKVLTWLYPNTKPRLSGYIKLCNSLRNCLAELFRTRTIPDPILANYHEKNAYPSKTKAV